MDTKKKKIKRTILNGINDDDDMITEIIRELTTFKKISEVTSKQVLAWARRVEAQRVWKAIIKATKEGKKFDTLKKTRAKEQYVRAKASTTESHTIVNTVETRINFKDAQAMT